MFPRRVKFPGGILAFLQKVVGNFCFFINFSEIILSKETVHFIHYIGFL